MFYEALFNQPAMYFSWVVVIIFSICVHEYAHAAMALRCGDDTAAREGHLTLNPMVQMGMTSLVVLLLAGIAWGSVPIRPGALRRHVDAALVAFAGPAANVVIATISLLLAAATVAWIPAANPEVFHFLTLAARANIVLFFFNMLPIPMLDGWKVYATWITPMNWIPEAHLANVSWMLILVLWVSPAFSMIWRGADLIAGAGLDGLLAIF